MVIGKKKTLYKMVQEAKLSLG